MSGMVTVASFKEAVTATQNMKEMSDVVTEKCAALCTRFDLTETDLIGKIDAFLTNNELDSLGLEAFGKLEQVVIRESTKTVVQRKIAGSAAAASSSHMTATKPPLPNKRALDTPSPAFAQQNKRAAVTFATPDEISKVAKIPYRHGDEPSPESSQSPAVFADSQDENGLPKPVNTYTQRTNSGQSLTAMNPNLAMRGDFEPSDRIPLGMRCKVEINDDDFDNISQRYRYMFTTLDERARAIDKHLIKMQEAMCEMASISPADLQPVGVPSQDTVWVCGKICCESAEGKINKASVLLEGSRRDSGGRKVQLDLQNIPGFSLFPGQVVLVEGTNSSGRRMVARRIVEGVSPPLPATAPAKLLEFHHSTSYQGGQPLNVITAAGPFTTADNLDYLPFNDLMLRVAQTKPDLLILVGPFVDITQPILASGDAKLVDRDDETNEVIGSHGASFEMIFIERIVRDGLKVLFDSQEDFGQIPTHIVLVPSLNDGHHEFVFPQPPFGDREHIKSQFFEEALGALDVPFSKEGDARKRVHLMSNPCMFRMNEVLFGVTSNDVLFALSSDEVSCATGAGPGFHRIARLAAHVLQQRSFAPQFPPAANSVAQLDMRQARHWRMDLAPDVLILPSKLTHLAKDVQGTVVINPGQLAKGMSGGTFAEIAIHPLTESALRDAKIAGKEEFPHNVASRTGVNVLRI